GTQTRDYVHVFDVVAALLAAEASGGRGPFNVGTRVETSVLELAGRIGRAVGRDGFQADVSPPRPREGCRTTLDPTAAAERLGWRALRTMETGLEQTVAAEV